MIGTHWCQKRKKRKMHTFTFTFARPSQRLRSCKGHGVTQLYNQSGLGRTVHKISQRWTTRKLRVQHATSCHCGRTLKKNLSKCHPNVLMDGHVSCEVYKQNSTPNSLRDSRKQIKPAILQVSVQSDVQVETLIGRVCLPNPPLGTKFSQSPICDSFAP